MTSVKLTIDPEFRQLIRPLRRREYTLLEESILADGCRDPIVIWNNVIVDGHNRYEICSRHNVPFKTVSKNFECREAALVWICANQLGRRNLTEETRKYLIGVQYESEKIVSRIHNQAGRNQYSPSPKPGREENTRGHRHQTAIRIAEENHVSPGSVQKYAVFSRAIDEIREKEPMLVPKILSGQYKLSLNNVLDMADLPQEDLRRLNRKIDKDPGQFMQYRSARPTLVGSKGEHPATISPSAPSVKDMPAFDPDAEANSLTLTIPSWQSSMDRVKKTTNFTIVSPQAKANLNQALHGLGNTITELLLETEGK